MKVPIAILRSLTFFLIFCLDCILLIARKQKELITVRDTLIVLLQGLGFLIKLACTSALSKNRILGNNFVFQGYDRFPTTRESNVDNRSVSIVPLQKSSLSEENSSADWKIKLISSGSSSSSSPLQITPKASNFGIFFRNELIKGSFPFSGGQKIISLVGKRSEIEQ